MSRRDAGELIEGREIIQLFRVEGRDLASVAPIFATYRRALSGTLDASLHRIESEAALRAQLAPATGRKRFWDRLAARLGSGSRPLDLGPALATLQLDCAALIDNEALDLAFGPLDLPKGELLALRLRPTGTRVGASPTLWLSEAEGRIPGHVACFIDGAEQGAFGIAASTLHGGRISELEVPKHILYSPISQCNLNCIHCISSHTRNRLDKLAAPLKAQLAEWCAAGKVEAISTDYSGDILWAETRFGGELDFLFGLGVLLDINTNGACLTAAMSARLCRSPLGGLNISLDAAEPETFKRIRKGAPPLGEVIANIEGLMQARAAAGATFPVSISITLMRSNLREWPDFLRLGKRLGVDFVHARHLEAYTAEMEADSLWHDQAGYNSARLEIMALAEELGIAAGIPAPFSGTKVAGRGACAMPWLSSVILGNGDVQACCIPGTLMGNLHEATMAEIWNGPRYQELRATVNSARPLPACATCPIYRRTDNPDSYLIWSALQKQAAAGAAAA